MRSFVDRLGAVVRRLLAVVLLFVIIRTFIGIAIIVGQGGPEHGRALTLINAVLAAVCIGVALAVRRYAPPRREPPAS